jgi:hypothetical protein
VQYFSRVRGHEEPDGAGPGGARRALPTLVVPEVATPLPRTSQSDLEPIFDDEIQRLPEHTACRWCSQFSKEKCVYIGREAS